MTDNDNKLDAMLARMRESEPTLDGDDFTAAVMAQLPRNDGVPAWLQNTILLGATALGSAIVAWQMPVPPVTVLAQSLIANLPELVGASAAMMWGSAVAGIWVASRR